MRPITCRAIQRLDPQPGALREGFRHQNYMRFDCALPVKLREFGILVTARYWDAQYS